MALCPFATQRLIPPGPNDPRITPRIAILHVDAGNAESLFNFFNGRSGGVESHFHVKKTGEVEQYRDTDWQADAQLDANDFAVSIETQGFGAGEWTAEQLASIKELLLWLNKMHGIPLKRCTAWDGEGIGYHTMWGSPSHWTPSVKTCPGPDRIKQFDQLIVPWMVGLHGHRHASANIKSNPLMPLGDAAADIIQVAGHAGVIGWQEIHKLYRPTVRTLPGFTTYWPGRRFSRDANAVPISWRTAYFEMVASGVQRTHFGRPGVTPARYIAWVVLRDLRSGQVFWRVNTHYISAAFTRHRSRRPMWEKHDRKLGNLVLKLLWEHGEHGVVGGDFNNEIGSGRLNAMLRIHGGDHVGQHYDHEYVFGGDAGPMTRLPLNSDHDGIVTRITFKESS